MIFENEICVTDAGASGGDGFGGGQLFFAAGFAPKLNDGGNGDVESAVGGARDFLRLLENSPKSRR